MDTRLISNLIDVSLCLVTLFIAVRSFDVYVHFRFQRLFVLGLSMALGSLSAAADFTSHYVTFTRLSTDWFFYAAQICGYTFIFLSLVRSSAGYLRLIMMLELLISPVLLILLVLAPFLPPVPGGPVHVLLECARWLISFMIFFAYFFAFTSKAIVFNRFMTAAFLLLSLGNFMAMMQSFDPTLGSQLLGNVGSITNIFGLIALIIAVSWN